MKRHIIRYFIVLGIITITVYNIYLNVSKEQIKLPAFVTTLHALATENVSTEAGQLPPGFVIGQTMGATFYFSGFNIGVVVSREPGISIGGDFAIIYCCLTSNSGNACKKSEEDERCKNLKL